MSKESGGFLRKVARFVANPTTDWTELDAPKEDAGESDYAKGEIKAMIERKRRNDFVRKRELDMLRKIRREGLSPDNALALSSPSNMDPDSRPQGGARSDIAVKAKIDEIELQMVGGASRQPPMMQPAALPSAPGRLADPATTAPNTLTAPATLPYDDEPPQISQAVLDMARATAPRMASNKPTASAQPSIHGDLNVHVVEVVHDPELDEAVIAFANADFDQCEQNLLDLVHPGAERHDQAETWLVLFDLYRALDLQQKFDNLAVSYAQKFGVSAPQWYSLPQKVASFLSNKDNRNLSAPDISSAVLNAPTTEPAELEQAPVSLEGWIAPTSFDQEAAASLRIEVLQMPRPWIMDWSNVSSVSPEGAAQLVQLMRQWAREAQELIWIGVPQLLDVLGESSPTGVKDADPAYWMLRLEVLRLCNRPDQFDETAIDYCVTYELSPPSWEHASCRVREQTDNIHPHTRPLSHVGEVTTSFVESQMHDEVEFVQVAALNLSGQLVGDIGQTLSQLDDQLSASVTLEIDCSYLLRVDFIAAGDLLNWVLARRAEDRQVVFNNPHRLIALFFGAMGINEHAKVKLQTT
ncbi:MAG TPA: STAS domain-containing protein [Aquabacterium sp.]|uniref:STAS domain-containing protein n=1 Tax=Aquabacterium sp. TaxID=1872578 RepID=UPI002E316C57|nr:STAS domain-containing protein [Aquabacterium sp.]HEX5357571.1 STAS domain-containing protein [Aquabacterium sp.]